MAPLFALTEDWAKDALLKADVSAVRVERVFPPYDTGDDLEVLYLDDRERPRTAWLNPDGSLIATAAGW